MIAINEPGINAYLPVGETQDFFLGNQTVNTSIHTTLPTPYTIHSAERTCSSIRTNGSKCLMLRIVTKRPIGSDRIVSRALQSGRWRRQSGTMHRICSRVSITQITDKHAGLFPCRREVSTWAPHAGSVAKKHPLGGLPLYSRALKGVLIMAKRNDSSVFIWKRKS